MERLSPSKDPTLSVPDANPLVADDKKKKKCHGNRKLQRFKRKCRSRGMTEEQITQLISARNASEDNNQVDNTIVTNTSYIEKKANTKKRRRFNKRKRSERKNEEQTNAITTTVRFMSQLSIGQSPPKKRRKTNQNENHMANINPNLP